MSEPGEPSEQDAPVSDPGDLDEPLCTGCGRPFEKDQYYCAHCGTAVGNLTPYVPFVNIPFNYGPYARLRQVAGAKRWTRNLLYVMAGIYLLVILSMLVFFAYILLKNWILTLVILVPVLLAAWWGVKKSKPGDGSNGELRSTNDESNDNDPMTKA